MATEIVNVAPRVRQPDVYTFDAPNPVPADLVAAHFEILIDTVDKLAVGKSLTVQFFFSQDTVNYVFANGITWTSYGPGGLTVTDPTGNVTVNPNPRLTIPLISRVGQMFRGVLTLPQQLRIGISIQVS